MIDKEIEELYEEFKGLPSTNKIVRFNQKNDAFVLFIAKHILEDYIDFSFTKDNLDKITTFIVPPPDDSIDIFFEQEEPDESIFHIFQVKYEELTVSEIETCFARMRYVIQSYLRNPSDVKVNLRKIISNSNFNWTFAEENCRYYVVHTGKIGHVSKQRDDESIITLEHLQTILDSITIKSVPHANIRIDELSNAAQYDKVDGIASLLCNMSGYDLAVLNNRYINTALGRNILFGQNLRDSLNKKSKTYTQMISTINDEPENFWYYNNGISIIASKANLQKGQFVNPETNQVFSHESALLKNFSIINGAQTVSTLGAYLSDAEMNRDFTKIRNLQKVYVLARVVEIPNKKHKLRNKISIFNNSQNPITTREMTSRLN